MVCPQEKMLLVMKKIVMTIVPNEDMKGQVHAVSLYEYRSIWTWRADARVELSVHYSKMMEPPTTAMVVALFDWMMALWMKQSCGNCWIS